MPKRLLRSRNAYSIQIVRLAAKQPRRRRADQSHPQAPGYVILSKAYIFYPVKRHGTFSADLVFTNLNRTVNVIGPAGLGNFTVHIKGYEFNLFSGVSGATNAPSGASYFYFADKGTFHRNGFPITPVPLVLFRKAKRSSRPVLNG